MRLDPTTIAAREAIRDLINRYCTSADAGRLAEVTALFIVNGFIEFGGETYMGADGINGMFTSSAQKLQSVDITGRVLHCVTSTTIDVDGPDTAHARSYFTVMSGIGVDHWGRYRDEFTRDDGTWRFSRRVIAVDGRVPGGIGEALT